MKDRIKQIRKEAGMTQEKFAEQLGLKRNTIATYETGKSEPMDNIIISICREFNVNEQWLRTGEGEMRTQISGEERYSINVAKLQRTNDETIMRWVNAIAETNPEILKEIESFLKNLLDIEC